MLNDQGEAVIKAVLDFVDEQSANALALGFSDNDPAALRSGSGPG